MARDANRRNIWLVVYRSIFSNMDPYKIGICGVDTRPDKFRVPGCIIGRATTTNPPGINSRGPNGIVSDNHRMYPGPD